MKGKIKTLLLAGTLSAPLLLGGCYSHKAAGAATGASWGSTIGQAVGAIAGGNSRSYGWGTLIGMAGGAAVGAGVGAAMDRKQQGTPQPSGVAGDDVYYTPADGNSAPGRTTAPVATLRSDGAMPLEVSDLQWEDDGDATLRSGESARLTFRVANRSQRTLSDVAPVIVETTGARRVTLSPPIAIERLEPGAAVRYTAAVVSTGRMKAGRLRFTVHMAQGATQVSDALEIAVATAR